MSEEILKALMQLFAIVAKQDDGASQNIEKFVEEFLYTQLNEELVIEYKKLYEEFLGPADAEGAEPKKKLTSVKDSVRTLGICKKINKTMGYLTRYNLFASDEQIRQKCFVYTE